jgi:hypothetical protein
VQLAGVRLIGLSPSTSKQLKVDFGVNRLNRTELQELAKHRLIDAEALIAASRWSGAYYLAGYAIECASKAAVLRYVELTGIIFEDKKFAEKCWTHDIEVLVKMADLEKTRGDAIQTNAELGTNWLIAKDWNELSRYRNSTRNQAQAMYKAVSDPTNGVLQWIKLHWLMSRSMRAVNSQKTSISTRWLMFSFG